jgi:CDP-diacylglycerol pyrophosphatase
MQPTLNLPIPCLNVDTERGFVVIWALGDETQILIVPTTKIDGIESPIVLQDRMPNLWPFAWNERNRVTASAHRLERHWHGDKLATRAHAAPIAYPPPTVRTLE